MRQRLPPHDCFLPALLSHRDHALLEDDSSSLLTTWILPKILRADLLSPQYADMASADDDDASPVEGDCHACSGIRPSRPCKMGSNAGACLADDILPSGSSPCPASCFLPSACAPSDGMDESNLAMGKIAFACDGISLDGFKSANGKIESCFYDDEISMEALISVRGQFTSCGYDKEIAVDIPSKEDITCRIVEDETDIDGLQSSRNRITSGDEIFAEEETSICFSNDGVPMEKVTPAKKIGYCDSGDKMFMSGISSDMPMKKKIKSGIYFHGIGVELHVPTQKNGCHISNGIFPKEKISASISYDGISLDRRRICDEIAAKGKIGSSCVTDESDGEAAMYGFSDTKLSTEERFICSGSSDNRIAVVGSTEGICAEEEACGSQRSQGWGSKEESSIKEAEASTSRGVSDGGDSCEAQQDYLPGLHDEVAQRCLAFVSLADRGRLAGVSKRHRMLVRSRLFFDLRRRYGVVERWVCIYTSGDGVWMAYDPVRNVWSNLPRADINPIFAFADRESLSAGAHLLWLGREAFNFACYRYDLSTNSWDVGPPMVNARCLFASASCGDHAYVAGGFDVGSMLPSVLCSAEIYDASSGSWTALPPMHTPRQKCSGAFMDGKFYVIGGKDANHNCLTSGEVYDPATRTWTIIPDMYVQHTSQSFEPSPPLVAVAGNQLYSIESSTNLLKVYNKGTNTWKVLGPVPVRTDICNGWGLAFKALGDELFVIGSYQDCPTSREGVAVFSLKPQLDAEAPEWHPHAHPPEWRLLNLRVRGSGSFLYNCAIMVC